MVTVSAPGKIHLMGEHAVVYGRPALLSAINLRLSVSVQSSTTSTHIIHIEDSQAHEYIEHILSLVSDHIHNPLPFLDISISSEFPFGYHLGSSASIAVATIGAVLYFVKKIWNPIEINQLAYEAEKKQHGNPSGGDNTAVTFGGFVWYRKELEFLKSMWQLPFHPAKNLNHFFLINTGKPLETTGEMVSLVGSKYREDTPKMEEIFSLNEKQTKKIASALKEGDEISLIDAIHKGEKTLEDMGVVSESIKKVVSLIESNGGAVKILGGGGKSGPVGFLLCYHHEPLQIEKLLAPYAFSLQSIRLGEEGVRLEKKE